MERFQQMLNDSRRLGMQHVYNPNTHKAQVEDLQAEVSLRCIEKFSTSTPEKKSVHMVLFVSLFPDCHQVTIYSHSHSHLDELLYHRSTDRAET